MNAALQDFRTIWRAAALHRGSGSTRGVFLVAGAIASCGIIVALLGDLHPMQTLRFAIAAVFMALAFIWTFLFVPGSIRLNSPTNAWLLPRQRRRLLQMTAAYWCVVMLGIAYGLGDWHVLPIVALGTLGMTLLIAGNKYISYLLMLGGNGPWLVHTVLPPAWTERMTGSTAFLVMDILIVPAAAWSLRWLYPARGDASIGRRGGQLKRVSQFDLCGDTKQPVPDGMGWRGNLSLYRVALHCARRRADPGAMLMHALGPMAHWTAWAGAVVVIVAIGVGAHIVLGSSYGTEVRSVTGGVMGAGAMMALITVFSTAPYGQQLRRTQGEQALLRLTPLAGNGALLNRRLAAGLLRQALVVWLLLTVASTGAALLFGAGPDALLRQMGLCSLAGQVAMMGLLGDYARGAGGWHLALSLRAGAYALVQALVAMGLGKLTGTTAWPWLIEISLSVCLVQLRLDWKRMLAAPPAFPAGRMA